MLVDLTGTRGQGVDDKAPAPAFVGRAVCGPPVLDKGRAAIGDPNEQGLIVGEVERWRGG
jgi:hypothetical protein